MRKLFFLTTLAVFLATAQSADATCPKVRTTSKKVVLTELYPAPDSGEEEFIEIRNTGRRKIDVGGWKLSDASGKTYELDDDDLPRTIIKSGKRLVIPQSASGIYLNNGADSVTLAQANDKVRSSTEYSDAPTGQSWSRVGGQWQWTPVTRGKKNRAADALEDGEVTASSDTAQTSADIRLSELLPNPEGSDATDEWIAVEHAGTQEVNLNGWILRDGSREHTIEGISIAPGEELIFGIDVTSVSLNNSGETIELVDPFGDVIDSTTYDAAESGLAWARFDNDWEWTSEPTPGAINERSAGSDAEDSGSADVLSITEFRALENDATALVEGVVTAEAGLLGSQYFYMQDDGAGVQVYSYTQDFPELALGNHVTVSGTKSESRSEARMKTASAADIVVNGEAEVAATVVDTLDESVEGMLVTVSGLVTSRSSDEMTLDDSTRVMIRDNVSVDMSRVEDGDTVTVIGVVSQSSDEYRLLPRGDDDVVVEGSTTAAASAGGVGDGHIQIGQKEEASAADNQTRNAAGAAAGLLSLSGGLAWRSDRAREWIKKTLGMKNGATGPMGANLGASAPAPSVDTVSAQQPLPTRMTVEPPPYPLREETVRYATPHNI
jgi:DNA/RNA endonuclease YhcR with UshA esterase domain